jgi:uncharacterized protein YbbC (DUF1343 family)
VVALAVWIVLVSSAETRAQASSRVDVGAAVLAEEEFGFLRGHRVGLITNHTAVVGDQHLADLLHRAPDVDLGALFAPEHGIRGSADAGAHIDHTVDSRTGTPIFSLHGEVQKPTPEMLDGLNALVFDVQDVGTRFYTYISTMGLAMQAAAQQGLRFVVLDRPNPIAPLPVEGFELELEHRSFIGMYDIPVSHGMTVGEFAYMIQGEAMLDGLEGLELNVVPMRGWSRDMLWTDTGLEWIPPSPNLPRFESAVVYPGACFFGSTSANEGRGTLDPFILVGAPWADSGQLAEQLNGQRLPGVRFEPVSYTPMSIEGMSTNPKLLGVEVHGIRHVVTDARSVRPVELGVYTLHTFYHHAPESERKTFFHEQPMLNVSGTDRLFRMIEDGHTPEEIIAGWEDDVLRFMTRRQRYLLYD